VVEDWEKLGSRSLADYRVLRVRQDTVRSPRTNAVHDFYVLEMDPWINIIAITPQRKVVMIHQYRHGTEEVSLEIPGGIVEGDDTSMAEAARRELVEETGYDAEEMVFLGKVKPNPALQDNQCYSFLALGAHPIGEQALDAGEDISVEEIPLEEIPGLIAAGRLNHGLVVVAFYFLEQYEKGRSE
jgi:ADP-ribose pyrophosphatase